MVIVLVIIAMWRYDNDENEGGDVLKMKMIVVMILSERKKEGGK